jgi:excisionase family DNA binding protein
MANGAATPVRRRSEWLSIEDFCEELGVPKSTAYKWAEAGTQAGRFPRYRRLPNGRIRIRRDWFEEWVDGLPAA